MGKIDSQNEQKSIDARGTGVSKWGKSICNRGTAVSKLGKIDFGNFFSKILGRGGSKGGKIDLR